MFALLKSLLNQRGRRTHRDIFTRSVKESVFGYRALMVELKGQQKKAERL